MEVFPSGILVVIDMLEVFPKGMLVVIDMLDVVVNVVVVVALPRGSPGVVTLGAGA